MPLDGHTEVSHDITVRAPAEQVYRLIAEVRNWPRIFTPTVHVDRIEEAGTSERIRIWATANGVLKTWTSVRELDPVRLRIGFRQEVPASPVAAMGGCWIVEPIAADLSRVRLLHDYRPIGDDPDKLAWIAAAVDTNSRSELEGLRQNAELARTDDLRLEFSDSVRIAGSVKDVYDFLDDAGRWPDRLPHVVRVGLTEDTPGLQVLEMDTRTKDGAVHTTRSVRVCFAPTRIVYKQTVVPALMTVHTGYWELTETGDGVIATSQHTVVLNTANIARVLGPDAGVGQARDYVRTALSGNSLATLGHAKAYAEARA